MTTPYHCEILADSIPTYKVLSPENKRQTRLITLAITIPRIILAEQNTHRTFCLAGDAILEFDLPSKQSKGEYRSHKMTISSFVDKWLNGANHITANPKKTISIDDVLPTKTYTGSEIAKLCGMTKTNVHTACRKGDLTAIKASDKRQWLVLGSDFFAWRNSKPIHTRFDMQPRLKNMKIRQINETTGDVQWSTVTDAFESGIKPVYEVTAGSFKVAGSEDHLVLTVDGWKKIKELTTADSIIVQKFGKREEDKVDENRFRVFDGRWRSVWQRKEREKMYVESPLCRTCGKSEGTDIHHILPVHTHPELAFENSNITLLCVPCHKAAHENQGWQGGTYLYGATAAVTSVTFRGNEPTYDLTIAGEFPNFFANDIVVHNSRNTASSRAIPVATRCNAIEEMPFIPSAFGKNQKGMSASQDLDEASSIEAEQIWREALADALRHARRLEKLGAHKQLANRITEPFAWVTQIISATEWDNYFALRDHAAAAPEIQAAARAMKAAIEASTPTVLNEREWHIPLVTDRERELYSTKVLIKLSVARCAAVSYEKHSSTKTLEEEMARHDMLAACGHMSPFEHQAFVCLNENIRGVSNFAAPWQQYRKTLLNEAVFKG